MKLKLFVIETKLSLKIRVLRIIFLSKLLLFNEFVEWV